jgi:hypothetical protein
VFTPCNLTGVEGYRRILIVIQARLSAWLGIAADLLRLAAHEVAAGRAGRATLALAAAAQRLSFQCAEYATIVLQRLDEMGKSLAQGAAQQLDMQTHLTELSLGTQGRLQLVHQRLEALGAAVCCWQASNIAGAPGARHQQTPPPHLPSPQQQAQQQQQQQPQQPQQALQPIQQAANTANTAAALAAEARAAAGGAAAGGAAKAGC